MSQVDEWVSAEFQSLAEVINEYDPHLWLEWIPPEQQIHLTDKSKVFRVIDDRTNSVVMHADSLSNPADILTQLWNMDQMHGNVVARLDNRNRAVELLQLKKQKDSFDEARDFVEFIAKNAKSRWQHDGRVYDDEFRDLGSVTTVIDK